MRPKRTSSVILLVLLALLLATASLSAAPAQRAIPADEDVPALPQAADADIAAKIQSAMSAAPLAVSLHATIKDFPAEPGGTMATLREGDNGYTCTPDNPGTPYTDPVCRDAIWAAFLAARMAGEDPVIDSVGIAYMLQGGTAISYEDPTILKLPEGQAFIQEKPHLMLLFPEKLDPAVFSTSPDSATPWIMWEGTPYEHLMIPLAWETNPPKGDALHSAQSAAPLDVAEGATIMNFPSEVVLREGSSDMNCIAFAPFMAIQYAVCQHSSSEAFWVMGMQLRAGGMAQGDIDQARIDAMVDGTLEIPVMGAARYFLLGGRPQNLSSLMAVHLPNATGESTGFSTDPDNYRPRLMDAGTPNAHVMMPGN